MSAGKPLADKPYELEAGKYYSLAIKADGSQELGLSGPEFFRNMWINEVVINDIEIRPLFTMEDFGDAMTPELREQEERIMAGAAKRRAG